MGNFHSGRPAYHPMDRVDFEVQQWGESTGALIAHACFFLTHYDPIPQTNRCKADRTLPVAGVEGRP